VHPRNTSGVKSEGLEGTLSGLFSFCNPYVYSRQRGGGCDRAIGRGPSIVWGVGSKKRVGFSAQSSKRGAAAWNRKTERERGP